MLNPERQSAQMSKITNDGLTRSGIGCIIAVHIWQRGCQRVNVKHSKCKTDQSDCLEIGSSLVANFWFTSSSITLNSTFVLSSKYLEETCNTMNLQKTNNLIQESCHKKTAKRHPTLIPPEILEWSHGREETGAFCHLVPKTESNFLVFTVLIFKNSEIHEVH